MAARKTKSKPKNKSKAARRSAPRRPQVAAVASTSNSVSKSVAASTAELLADLPRLADTEREAFRAQFDDAACAALGDRTKSAAVVQDAFAWAKIIDATVRAHPHAVRRYGATRLAWFVECLRALERAIADQASVRDFARQVNLDTQLARTAAIAVRNDLRDTLGILAGANERERDALQKAIDARREASDDVALSASLGALADLAEGWLARRDEAARTLVTSVSLTRGDVDAARAAADELSRASGADAGGRPDSPRDAPTTNVAEGRVLEEMRLAMRVFSRANETNRAVPRLVPGAGTRHVLSSHSRPTKAPPEQGVSSPPASPSPSTPAPPETSSSPVA